MHRRTAALVVLVAMLALLLPAAAIAAGASLRGPADGVVSSATALDVRVTREAFEAISAIDLGLRRGGTPIEGSTTKRLCEGFRDCPNSDRSADYRVPFDPRTGAPFLTSARILPNGAYELRVSIEVGRDVQQRSLNLTLSVPPASPSDVRAVASDQQVAVEWGRAPEPDLTGYRVERASEGRGWDSRAQLGASSTAFADEPGPGTHRYRVVALRPDGKGGAYEVTSREVSVTVAAPPADEPEGRDGAGTREGNGGDPDGELDGEDGEDAIDGGRSSRDGPSDEEDPTDDADAGPRASSDSTGNGSGSSGSTQRRRTQAPSFSLNRGGASTPALPWDDPEYFQEELSYDDPQTADAEGRPRGDDGEVLLSVPGAGVFGGGTDDNRAAVPIAGGLLMTAMGLHLWRWLRVPLT